MNRPPRGIMPRYIWDEKRIEELCYAIKRFIDAGKIDENVKEWVRELIGFFPNKTTSEIMKLTQKYVGEHPSHVESFKDLIVLETKLKQYDVIKILMLSQTFAEDGPKVGDTGVIIEVYDLGYEIEGFDESGNTLWVETIIGARLELVCRGKK